MLLSVQHLKIVFRHEGHTFEPVRDVSFSLDRGARVSLVGESGCGKSLTALALAHLPPTDTADVSGHISRAPHARFAYIFQNPSESLNPTLRLSTQIREALPPGLSSVQQDRRILELLARTGLPDPQRAMRAFPCELSGGQQQRGMIAMALASQPDLLIADEPTTALDVTTQKQVLDLIDSLADETHMAVLFITHNLGLVAHRMNEVHVMYAGRLVESGPVEDVLSQPHHPYTQGLLAAVPALDAPRNAPLADIPGTVPPPDQWPSGCAFWPRCACASDVCRTHQPPVRTLQRTLCACYHVTESPWSAVS